MKSYSNLPPEQHPIQKLADRFNADEGQWQDLRRKILRKLRDAKINGK